MRLLRTALLCLALLAPAGLAAQADTTAPGAQQGQWNSPSVLALVNSAISLRQQQLADTGLRDYQAMARGYLTFLAQLGDEFRLPPKIVKADQIAVQVFWKAPNQSKQILVGLRDTLLLPGDIGYYRDRYGIIQNNFPDRIRLGDGNDVRDVPHPLSPLGRATYDYALGDSVRIELGDRTITVNEVRVRPRDPSRPAVVGTLYLDSQSAQLARMALTFTRAAVLDERIETLTVTLENGLVEGRFWLPRRQELEVARTARWLDFPARGIIRGRWEICCYEVNQSLPPDRFVGPEIIALSPDELRSYPFGGLVVDSIPEDVGLATQQDVELVRARAEELVRARALDRGRGVALSGRGLSEFIRVNRVEGLALGTGGLLTPIPAFSLSAHARYGLEDEKAKGRMALTLNNVRFTPELFAEWDHRDMGDIAETSRARNSLAAQEFGSDYTNPYEVRAAGVRLGIGNAAGVRWRLEGAYETHRQLYVHASPANGSYERTFPVREIHGASASLSGDTRYMEGPAGTVYRWGGRVSLAMPYGSGSSGDLAGRASMTLDVEGRVSGRRVFSRTTVAGVVGSNPLPQHRVFLGGPTSAPGYDYHSLTGRVGVSQRVELWQSVPFVAVPLGRFGRAPASMTIAPYVHAAYVGGDAAGGREGVYPSIGVAGLFLFDLLRLDVARGLRYGRWSFGVDVSRDLWGIL
ncbi:MAG TPA: hypothetical protein VKZ41_00460 [Gemmatimonadales bacterium]|nr:hypothetical protein [Gemmatimonadales bacterium]